MNYKNESDKVYNLIQIYSYEYSPLSVANSLSAEQEAKIKSLGLIKLADNTYRFYRFMDLYDLNRYMSDNGLVFSNAVFCFIEDHLGELGGILFEEDHKPRENPENPDYKYFKDYGKHAKEALDTPHPNKYPSGNKELMYPDGYAVLKNKPINNKPLNNKLNVGTFSGRRGSEDTYSSNSRYNPRKRYTGSEDETAGLWYDFD